MTNKLEQNQKRKFLRERRSDDGLEVPKFNSTENFHCASWYLGNLKDFLRYLRFNEEVN